MTEYIQHDSSVAYARCHDLIQQLPSQFEKGELVFKGRNELRSFMVDDKHVVVKRFRRNGLAKRLLSLIKKGKARKSYDNAQELCRRGIVTPAPVAFVEVRRLGMVVDDYYVCEHTDWHPIVEGLIVSQPYDALLAAAFARFVAMLHEKGIVHRDLNSTNVLFRSTAEGYTFQLIDVNRMHFCAMGEKVSRESCLKNLTLFSNCDDMFRYVLSQYVEARGWDQRWVDTGLRIKRAHDRHWKWKQWLKHPK